MKTEPTLEAWAQIRYEYEHTDKPVDDISLDYGVSASTLRERARRWDWTRRRQPIPLEGPPAAPPPEYPAPLAFTAAPLVPALPPIGALAPLQPAVVASETGADAPAPLAAPVEEASPDPSEIVPRLQGAVARVLPAIEATVGKIAAAPMPPREMERAARALSSLTRTLRELNALLSLHQARGAGHEDDGPEDIDAFRIELARKIDAFVASRTGESDDSAQQAT